MNNRFFQKTSALLANFSLFLHIFLPALTAIPAYAEEIPTPTPVVENTLIPTPIEPTSIPEVTIAPTETPVEPTVEPTAVPAEAPTITPIVTENPTITPTVTDSPTISPTVTVEPTAIPTATTTPTITLEPTPIQSPSPWTFEKVELNKEYIAPQNSEVKLTFTKLPTTAGNIKIEEITLTKEQVEQTGSLSDKAYDITSDMVDGSFAYNLSLPIPESAKGQSIEVKFSEDISEINSAEKVENTVTNTDTSVSVKNLDHFTIFVVVVYNSIPVIYPGSFPSVGYEATSTKEFGDHLKLTGTDRKLNKVTIGLTNWACGNDYTKVGGNWVANPNRVAEGCQTTSGSNFIHPITLNIYNVDKSSSIPKVGSKIITQTIDATILYRPSRDITNCSGTDKWYDSVSGCSNGYAFNIEYDFTSAGIILPDEIITTVAYNTADYGESPIHVAGPYNSLNVSLSTSKPLEGIDFDPDAVFWNTSVASFYTDSGASGVGILRQDTAWSPYTPVIKIETQGTPVCNSTSSFDDMSPGSVDSQGGWSSTGPYDQAIVSNSYGFDSFGCKTLRLSNGVASGSFGDQTFSYSNTNEAGETSATSDGQSDGTRQNHYEAQFDFASAQLAQQPGLSISVSPDRGDGSRMSYLRFVDDTDGIDVFFDDVSGTTSPVNFDEMKIADNLSRTTTHSVKFVIDFVDGPSNDIVEIYIDGLLVKTGTTWENYYRFDTEASSEQGPRTTDNLLFRAGGTSVSANNGKGFLFDNISLSSSIILPDPTPTLTPTPTLVPTPTPTSVPVISNTNTSSEVGGAVLGVASASVCNDQKPSSAPKLLSAVAGANSVTLTWSLASDPTSYYLVTYGNQSGSQQYGSPNVGPAGTTSYTAKSLSGNTTYYFRVRAGNGCTPGDFSNELSATAQGQFFIATPATDFQPGVLGDQTTDSSVIITATETPTPTPTLNPSLSDVLGVSTKNMNYLWWLLLILPLYVVIRLILKNKRN